MRKLWIGFWLVSLGCAIRNFNLQKIPFFNQKVITNPLRYQSDDPRQFAQITGDDCLKKLNSNFKEGLSSSDVIQRQKSSGFNELPAPSKPSFLKLFIEQYSDRLSQILIGTVLLSILSASFQPGFLHALVEPAIILAILLLNGLAGAFQSKSAESSVAALSKLLPKYSSVLRNGQWATIPSKFLVPGDIILLRTGDHVPADARLLELRSNSFSTDESFLTGENVPVLKCIDELNGSIDGVSSLTNMVFSGSTVTSGSAVAVITHTGKESEIGKINTDVQQSKSEKSITPLTQSLDRFTHQLTNMIGTICVGLWVGNLPNFRSFGSWYKGALHYTKNIIALGVAAVPEGLPSAVTLCLSLGTRRMAKKNVIIRKLSSLETLGCTSVICTDKTGTLTTNKMCVTNLVTFSLENNQLVPCENLIEGNSYSPDGKIKNKDGKPHSPALAEDISKICALCNNAEISYDSRDGYSRVGEPTEAALKVLVEKIGRSLDGSNASTALNHYSQQINGRYDRLYEAEFDRERKFMSVVCQNSSGNLILFSKGAPEMLLSRSQFIKLANGTIIPINEQIRNNILIKLQELSQRPLRVIALAYKDNFTPISTPLSLNSSLMSDLEDKLIFTGLCGITDPLRDDIRSSLQKCQEAGIRVIMITGDSKDTALSIGYQAGIFNRTMNIHSGEDDVDNHIISGKQFNELSHSQQIDFLQNIHSQKNKIFYRMESRDKKLLIQLLQKHCHDIVAMTGDGINDASALALADIGIAMGITGTEVTKESSDMILIDDSFSSIVAAIEEGRSLYSNLQSMISYLISCNLGEIGIILITSLLGLPPIFDPLHLLYINLVTDGPPATALSFNPSNPNLMKKPPRDRSEALITRPMLWRYLVSSSYEIIATVGSFLWWYRRHGVPLRSLLNWRNCQPSSTLSFPACAIASPLPQSMALSVLLLIEIFKALGSISHDSSLLSIPPWKNKWLLSMVSLSFTVHLLIMYNPFLSSLLAISPLSFREWKMAFLFSTPILIITEFMKFFQTEKLTRNKLDSSMLE